MTRNTETFDPKAALAALRESEASTLKATDPNPPLMYTLWGSVYALGYLALHAALFGWLALSVPVALLIIAGLVVAGSVVSTVMGVRAGFDLKGKSSRQGMFYGFSWTAGILSAGAIVVAVVQLELAAATTVWLSSVVIILLIGVLFAAGGALFLNPAMFFQGIALLGTNLIAVLIGPTPWVLIGWLASCAVLFGGAVVEARGGGRSGR